MKTIGHHVKYIHLWLAELECTFSVLLGHIQVAFLDFAVTTSIELFYMQVCTMYCYLISF